MEEYMKVCSNNGLFPLPTELQLEVFKYLDEKDLSTSATVCKVWNKFAEDSSLWKKHFHKHWKRQSHSEIAKYGKNWKKICKKKHEKSKTVRVNKFERPLDDAYKQTTYKLPDFVPTEICDLKVENKFAFIKINKGAAQLYHLEKEKCQLVFNNQNEENSLLIHYYDEHIIQLFRDGNLYRWNVQQERPHYPIVHLRDFDEAHFDQNHLLLILPQRKKFVIVDIETGSICYESNCLPSEIQSFVYRNNQAFVQCVDGSLYFFNRDTRGQNSSFTLLESHISFPLCLHLVCFDKQRVIAVGDDGIRRDCKVWDACTGKTVFEGQLKPSYLDIFNRDDRKIITASDYNGEVLAIGFDCGHVLLYNPDTGTSIGEANCSISPIKRIYLEKEHFVGVSEVFGVLKFVNNSIQNKSYAYLCPKRPDNFPVFAHKLAGSFYTEQKTVICSNDGWLDIWKFTKKVPSKIIV